MNEETYNALREVLKWEMFTAVQEGDLERQENAKIVGKWFRNVAQYNK